MKKILISVLIVVLIIMAYFAIFKGISIGGFQILSVEQINDENNKLTQEIAQTETLMNSDYKTKTKELESSIAKLLEAKGEYLDLAQVSTENEIRQANQEEEYTVEFLLTSLGRHTKAQGVNLDYTITAGAAETNLNNITFTVTGKYIPIINFVAAIEDDAKLGFRIQNFKLVPQSDEILQATFLVTNVKVKKEQVAPTTQRAITDQSTTNSNNTQTNSQASSSNNVVENSTASSTNNTATNSQTTNTTP